MSTGKSIILSDQAIVAAVELAKKQRLGNFVPGNSLAGKRTLTRNGKRIRLQIDADQLRLSLQGRGFSAMSLHDGKQNHRSQEDRDVTLSCHPSPQ